MAGAVVGVLLALILIAAILFYLLFYRKKRKNAPKSEQPGNDIRLVAVRGRPTGVTAPCNDPQGHPLLSVPWKAGLPMDATAVHLSSYAATWHLVIYLY